MNYQQIQQEVARNLGLLAEDDTTILTNSRVTLAGIKRQINVQYQDKITPVLARKFPHDFEVITYPLQTYRSSFTVDAASTGTTLVSTTPVFANSDEGLTVQFVNGANGTASFDQCTIKTYTNNTTVIIEETVQNSWVGKTAYILGNEYSFNGTVTDVREVGYLDIIYQYNGTPMRAELRYKADLPPKSLPIFNYATPWMYETDIKEGGQYIRGFGILPYPTDYRGTIQFQYIQRPPAMSSDADTPRLENIGISDVIVNGVTAWGLRIMGQPDLAQQYEEVERVGGGVVVTHPKGVARLCTNYRPVNRYGASKLRLAPKWIQLQKRSI